MKGAKPKSDSVIPLRGDDAQVYEKHWAAAVARAKELKPRGLAPAVQKIYDRLAPTLTHATKARLKEHNVDAFVELCVAKHHLESLRKKLDDPGFGWDYQPGSGRNGDLVKNRPEVARYNEAWRQYVKLASDFGMTPAAERGLATDNQPDLPFPDGDFT